MNLIEQARLDVLLITTNGDEFGQPVLFIPPVGDPVTVIARANKHHMGVDPQTGMTMNSKTPSVSVSEYALTLAGINCRNGAGQVDLKKYKVRWTDSSGIAATYIIDQQFPDETLGLIVLLLTDYKE